MTASELASLLKARRVGKGRWVARCPAHPDRNPSLSIAEGRKVPILIKCQSQGCKPKAILDALGLRWDAFMGPSLSRVDLRAIELERARLEALERQRMAIHGDLCRRAIWWEDQAAGWGRYLALHPGPDGDRFVGYFHASLRNIRLLNAAIAGFRHPLMYPSETITWRKRWVQTLQPAPKN